MGSYLRLHLSIVKEQPREGGMRNIVAHDYANADLKIIWDGPPVAEICGGLKKFCARRRWSI